MQAQPITISSSAICLVAVSSPLARPVRFKACPNHGCHVPAHPTGATTSTIRHPPHIVLRVRLINGATERSARKAQSRRRSSQSATSASLSTLQYLSCSQVPREVNLTLAISLYHKQLIRKASKQCTQYPVDPACHPRNHHPTSCPVSSNHLCRPIFQIMCSFLLEGWPRCSSGKQTTK